MKFEKSRKVYRSKTFSPETMLPWLGIWPELQTFDEKRRPETSDIWLQKMFHKASMTAWLHIQGPDSPVGINLKRWDWLESRMLIQGFNFSDSPYALRILRPLRERKRVNKFTWFNWHQFLLHETFYLPVDRVLWHFVDGKPPCKPGIWRDRSQPKINLRRYVEMTWFENPLNEYGYCERILKRPKPSILMTCCMKLVDIWPSVIGPNTADDPRIWRPLQLWGCSRHCGFHKDVLLHKTHKTHSTFAEETARFSKSSKSHHLWSSSQPNPIPKPW